MKKISLAVLATSVIAVSSSCSSLVESTRKMIDGDAPRKNPEKAQWVTKSQYDDLMIKYKDLNDKYEKLKEEKQDTNPNLNQANELASNTKSNETETVDVFGQNGLATEVSQSLDQASQSAQPQVGVAPISESQVDDEVKAYKKAVVLKSNGKMDDSLKVFQYLEKSPTKQIRVRSRIHIGEIYLMNKQYDLALQVFETVIAQDAFSGRVLDALKGAVSACQNLGLTEKKLRYQSMLSDVFGMKG